MASYFVTVAAQGDSEDINATIAADNAEAAEVVENRIYAMRASWLRLLLPAIESFLVR